MDERYAQAGIKIKILNINMGTPIADPSGGFINGEPVAGYIQDPGIDLPSGPGIDWSNGFDSYQILGFSTISQEEMATIGSMKDNDPDSIDIFYFEKFHPQITDYSGFSYSLSSSTLTSGAVPISFINTIVLKENSNPYTLPHEGMHVLLNLGEKMHGYIDNPANRSSTVALNNATSNTRGPQGQGHGFTKLIGPYPSKIGSTLDEGLTINYMDLMRDASEHLPSQ